MCPLLPLIGIMKEFQNMFKFVNLPTIPLLGIPGFKDAGIPDFVPLNLPPIRGCTFLSGIAQ